MKKTQTSLYIHQGLHEVLHSHSYLFVLSFIQIFLEPFYIPRAWAIPWNLCRCKADILAEEREKTVNPANLWAVEYAKTVSAVGKKLN